MYLFQVYPVAFIPQGPHRPKRFRTMEQERTRLSSRRKDSGAPLLPAHQRAIRGQGPVQVLQPQAPARTPVEKQGLDTGPEQGKELSKVVGHLGGDEQSTAGWGRGRGE